MHHHESLYLHVLHAAIHSFIYFVVVIALVVVVVVKEPEKKTVERT